MRFYADHFSRVAEAYAACRPHYPAQLFSYLADTAPARGLAWDCAAGSGQATLPLAAEFQQVVGTDISAEMLQRAPHHPRISYRVCPADQSGLNDASADLVSIGQALHWLDLEPFYAEVDRVLRPRGILAAWCYGTQLLKDRSLDAVLGRYYSDVVGSYWPAERSHVEAGYRTLPFPYPEIHAPALAIEERWTMPQLLGYIGTWSATQRFRETEGFDPVIQLGRELGSLWGDPATVRLVSWPLSLRVGRKPVPFTSRGSDARSRS
jgi:SAM-dependent methyltransferase